MINSTFSYKKDFIYSNGDTDIVLNIFDFHSDKEINIDVSFLDPIDYYCEPNFFIEYKDSNNILSIFYDFSYEANNGKSKELILEINVKGSYYKFKIDSSTKQNLLIQPKTFYGDDEKIVKIVLKDLIIQSFETENGEVWFLKKTIKRNDFSEIENGQIINN